MSSGPVISACVRGKVCGYSKDTSLADLGEDRIVCFSQIPSLTPSLPPSAFAYLQHVRALLVDAHKDARAILHWQAGRERSDFTHDVHGASLSHTRGGREGGREGRRLRLSLVFVIRGREGGREGGTERTFRLAPRRLAL